MNKQFFFILTILLFLINCNFKPEHYDKNLNGIWIVQPYNLDTLEYAEFLIEEDSIIFNLEFALNLRRQFRLEGDSMITGYGTSLFKVSGDSIIVNWNDGVLAFHKCLQCSPCEDYHFRYLQFLVKYVSSDTAKEVVKDMLWEYFGGTASSSNDALEFDETL